MRKRYWGILLAFVVLAQGQEAPTATAGFTGNKFYVSELDGAAEVWVQYLVHSTDPRDGRGPSDWVTLRVVGGTATEREDYEPVQESIFFDGGSGSQIKKFYITVRKDLLAEEDETIELQLGPALGSTTLSAATNATLVIVDATVGKVRFAQTNLFASEAAGEVEGELVREGGTKGDIEVDVAPQFSYGLGEAGFEDAQGPVRVKFAAGQDRATFKLKLTRDSLVEGTENLRVGLQDERNGAWVTKDELVVTIADDSIAVSQSADGIVVSWAAPCQGCELERAEGRLGGAWQKVTAAPVEADGKFTVTETLSPGQGAWFYRLRK
jgi:hypothetical protein